LVTINYYVGFRDRNNMGALCSFKVASDGLLNERA